MDRQTREYENRMDSAMGLPLDQQQQFWQLNTGGTSTGHRSSHHMQPAPPSEEYSLQPWARRETDHDVGGAPPAASAHVVVQADVAHGGTSFQGAGASSSTLPVATHVAAAFTSFFDPAPCTIRGASGSATPFVTGGASHYQHAPSTTAGSQFVLGENINRDIESLHRNLANFHSPESKDPLTATTRSTAEAPAVQQHHGVNANNADDVHDDNSYDDDDDLDLNGYSNGNRNRNDAPRTFPGLSEAEEDLDVRASIIDHPFYSEMIAAHIKILMVGAPKELSNKLDDITNRSQRLQRVSTKSIGDDPELDSFMRSYLDLLVKLGEDMGDFVNDFMQFKDTTTKQLESICGHYVDTNPDESDNFGFDIRAGPMDRGEDNELENTMVMEYPDSDVDNSIVIEDSLPAGELKQALFKKYRRHIPRLHADQFNRVRRKGKLPSHARTVLKEWFNDHTFWPYPSEAEKQHLQQLCNLSLRQINIWFINERQRHWTSEGRGGHPGANDGSTSGMVTVESRPIWNFTVSSNNV